MELHTNTQSTNGRNPAILTTTTVNVQQGA
jgi:hypothetical protein